MTPSLKDQVGERSRTAIALLLVLGGAFLYTRLVPRTSSTSHLDPRSLDTSEIRDRLRSGHWCEGPRHLLGAGESVECLGRRSTVVGELGLRSVTGDTAALEILAEFVRASDDQDLVQLSATVIGTRKIAAAENALKDRLVTGSLVRDSTTTESIAWALERLRSARGIRVLWENTPEDTLSVWSWHAIASLGSAHLPGEVIERARHKIKLKGISADAQLAAPRAR